MDVLWNAPGPGLWELDRSHFRGGTTPLVQSVMTGAMAAGMRRVMRDLGTPADTVQPAFVNGFCYTRLRPLISPDRTSTKLAPLPLLKLATRLHPEMRRRSRAADRALTDRPWREVIRHWETEGRRAIEAENLALQDVRLADLTDDSLIGHAEDVLAHCRKNIEHHFWLHGYDLGPIGLLLTTCVEWGIAPTDVIPLLEGASPSTGAPIAALARIRARVEAAGAQPSSLAELRGISPAIANDLDTYLRYRGSLLFSRYDIDGVTLGERPDLILATIMSSKVRIANDDLAQRTASVRDRVPEHERVEFDERLQEARAAMNLRDDNGPTTSEWPLGLLRLTVLEVGRRLLAAGRVACAEHAFEVTPDELEPGLMSGRGPSAATLAARQQQRIAWAALDAPPTLGTGASTPPLSVLPRSMGRMVETVQIVMQQLGMAGDRVALGDGLKGTGVGDVVYRGVVRRAGSPEQALDLMEPGDVLIVPFTTPAYNVVLSIAGAIVTAQGGPLSHAAVLARELGIPGVIGAPDALIDIPDGALVDVDPIAGEVRIVANV
jgi:pyruvate,water dikinase